MMKLFISLLLFLFCAGSQSQDMFDTISKETVLKPKMSYEVQIIEGSPVVVKWKDGRKAIVQIKKTPISELSIDYKVDQNNCVPYVGQNCKLSFNSRYFQIELVWAEHPQKNKIGETVVVIEKKGMVARSKMKLMGRYYAGFANVALDPSKLDKSSPVLSCDEYSWIPGGDKESPPDEWTVYQWVTDILRVNYETFASENTGYAGGMNLVFRKKENNIFELQEVPYVFAIRNNVFALYIAFLSETVKIITKNTNDDFCQIILKGDFQKFASKHDSLGRKLDQHVRPLIYGIDQTLFETPVNYWRSSMKEILLEDLLKFYVE